MFVLVLPFAASQTSAPSPVLVGSGPGPLVFFPVTPSTSAASVIVLLVLVVGVTPPVVVVSTVLALAILVLK